MSPEVSPIRPAWVERERRGDLRWIRENLYIFWPAAHQAFMHTGRGALVVDTTRQVAPGLGNPFAYLSELDLEKTNDEATQQMVQEYDPQQEFVVVLLKSEARTSTYRVRPQPTHH